MPAVESLSNTTYALRTNTTITAPTGIANDDLLLLLFITAENVEAPDPTPPAGFTILPGAWPIDVTGGVFNVEFRAYHKIASGETGDYTVTHVDTRSQGVMMRISGVDTTTPFSPNPTLNSGTADDTTASGLTTTVNNVMIVLAAFDWGDTANDLTPPTGTTPTFTEHLDVPLTYVAAGVLATAGATGDKTMANNSTGVNPWGAALIAIAPASGGAAPTACLPAIPTYPTIPTIAR